MNPCYIVFINGFKYEKEIINRMKKHSTMFSLYMGNTEFPANYEFLECVKVNACTLNQIGSFTKNIENIKFEAGKKYSTVYFATKVTGKRQYRDYEKLVICDKDIIFNNKISGYSIKLPIGEYNCEFI